MIIELHNEVIKYNHSGLRFNNQRFLTNKPDHICFVMIHKYITLLLTKKRTEAIIEINEIYQFFSFLFVLISLFFHHRAACLSGGKYH